MAEHRQHVQQVLQKLREHSLYLKLEKCEFHHPSVHFLGNIISAEGVQMDQGKRRFIKDYSSITAPLTSLLRGKPRTVCWNPSAHEAFLQLKMIFRTAPLLHHPDPELPFTVEVDASTTGAGAVLSQAVGDPPLLHPCAYYSRKLSPAEISVPLALCQGLLGAAHRSPGSGRPGSQRTLSLLQSRYWWPSVRRDTIRYVQSCSVCAMSTSPCQLPTGKLVPLPIPQRPWSHIGVDFVTDLPAAEGNTTILGLPTAMETAEILFQHLFHHFGLPEEIVSDRGPQFISHVWKAFFKQLGVSVNLSSGYHPQTNGQTERKIQELLGILSHGPTLLEQVPPVGRCVLGYQPPLFPWTEEPSNVPAVDHWFRESERAWDSAHHHLQRAVRQHKHFADIQRRPAPDFQPGDQVWLSTRDLRLRQPCRKLSPRYIGPFKILRRINKVTFQLQLQPRYRIHPTFHVSLLKPCYPSATEQPGAEVEPPPPEILEPPSIYTVHEILDSRRRGGQLEYLIDWEGYGPEERSWVSREDILDPTLLSDFHRDHPDRPAPRGRGRPRRPVRASGAAPGGGGSVRHSPQPPPSATPPVAPPTRSSSPEF
ncbi:Transposon Tf2-9 polyprotein [Labeo rohita]|uniref:Gypsy retrotransposon integrase-like protein 1 n=1 Tax=Labeo rohita TaxID=84645 RepID=A0ABQ8L927_LABRO|nr:Transposon Tf2-9 polyprotein [Labeo rohita]